ncbi:hypothetical protein COCSUDRAFT_63244 [Coccomyxa subellipsoidea C-169]|uniref:Uncharacterized protein n=1 Tax=Coccomyxa subellipsoidea (strain C-169) TaxID=574566 RepID=I0YZA0_COCSC|nr:hypothetical protein COCSUDRAFT_63244 [Coccomyxa subellipsoidea C-169]EIE23719.1 hypothetical protein COCSUDRAFT_63244 [Coccomyxa subellipsoidea C-169]|eukprot:XP_005648263.1 hypothetical protein COCSUDRAFT_63244 [Coccomyxa subellipsoidea C-169]
MAARWLRAKLSQTNSEEGLAVHPGSADLTLKLKDVDPAQAPALELNMSSKVRPRMAAVCQRSKPKHAHLKVKVENDVYCSYANRANSEFKYSPVPSNTNITTLSGVSEYSPDLPRFLGVPAGFLLPVYGRRAFSKSVWDIQILGVRGVANLVMNYPRAQAALLGSGAQNAELSFRVKRKDIEALHISGDDQYYDAVDEAAPAPFVSCWGNSQTCPFAAQQTAPTQSGRIATTTAALSSAPNDKPEAAVGKAARNDAMPLQKEDCMWNMARWQQPLRDALTAAAVPLHSALAAVAVPCWPQPGLPRSGSGQPSAASDDASPPGGSCREVAAAAAAACAEQTDAESVAAMAASTEHEPWLLLRADSLWQPVFEEVDTMSMCGEDEALFQYLDNIMDENSSEFADCESDTSADEWIERADDIVACAVGVAPRDQRCAQLASTGSSGYWTAASDHAPDQAGPASWRGASAARGDRCRGAAENLGCRQRASARRSQEDMQEMLQRRTALWLQSYV